MTTKFLVIYDDTTDTVRYAFLDLEEETATKLKSCRGGYLNAAGPDWDEGWLCSFLFPGNDGVLRKEFKPLADLHNIDGKYETVLIGFAG